jgi:hypothetical protein
MPERLLTVFWRPGGAAGRAQRARPSSRSRRLLPWTSTRGGREAPAADIRLVLPRAARVSEPSGSWSAPGRLWPGVRAVFGRASPREPVEGGGAGGRWDRRGLIGSRGAGASGGGRAGERLQCRRGALPEDARAAVKYLRERAAGTATFLPSSPVRSPEPVPDDNGVRWAARSLTAATEGWRATSSVGR